MDLLSRTLPLALYAIVISAFMQAPVVIMKLVESDQFRFGQFVLAYQVCVYFLVVPYLVSTVMLPVVSREALRGDGNDVGYVGLLVRLTCVVGAAAVVAFGPVIPALTEALFGAEYRQAGELLSVATWLAIPFSAVTFLLQLFFARGAYVPIGIYGALGAAIMMVAMPPAASIAPQTGAVLAIGVGLVVWLIATLVVTDRYVPTYERWRSVAAFACAVAAALAYTLMTGVAQWLQIAASLGILAAATIAFRAIDQADLRLLLRVMTGALRLSRS
jgi:O-antigen/teichoic acid export membrane protein